MYCFSKNNISNDYTNVFYFPRIIVHANEAILLNSNILQHFNLSLIETDGRYSGKEIIE